MGHSILASLHINMKLFLISALLTVFVGVSQQALTITGDRSDDCTEEVCRTMGLNDVNDEIWEQCGEACVQMLLELSCELAEECGTIYTYTSDIAYTCGFSCWDYFWSLVWGD